MSAGANGQSILKNRNFLLLWLAYFVSAAGNVIRITVFAFIITISRKNFSATVSNQPDSSLPV